MAYIGSKPANKPVVASDLDPAVITGQTALAVAPADTDEFLISDAGVLKRLDASLIGGGLNLLATTTCSDTSAVTFNGLFSSTYKNYMVQYSDIVNNGTDIAIRIRFRISNSDVTSSDYHWNRNNIATNSSSTVNQVAGDWNQSYISAGGISINGAASEYYKGNGYFYLYNPLGTDNYKFLQGEQNQMNADDTYIQNVRYVGNLHSAVTALSGLTIYPDTANFTTGTIKLYGIK